MGCDRQNSDKDEKTWLWRYDKVELLYDLGEVMRFRMVEINFDKSVEQNKGYYLIVF